MDTKIEDQHILKDSDVMEGEYYTISDMMNNTWYFLCDDATPRESDGHKTFVGRGFSPKSGGKFTEITLTYSDHKRVFRHSFLSEIEILNQAYDIKEEQEAPLPEFLQNTKLNEFING